MKESGASMFLAKLEFKELICDGVESLVDRWGLFLPDEARHLVCRRKWEVQEVASIVDRRRMWNNRSLIRVGLNDMTHIWMCV